ncbi:SSL2 DNA or RNA helicases of superfamily II [uncultured Caudovirales phage]|uniref:SSL2 DNA or RNA helicases of superfamily II n=1 Tax=uncultured Caudovirales phage TaxID=2100421 RepID=A0A6J5R402_9CAUD|nr:SSL2 DNA or RNA helicases of superfamily II [uncultured Caudovirales phage]CAB4185299.1 SSL2 DNA or RNA helicases of superfamily II [uncultured Caudovirales phage]CAB4188348.1 SSL2 DNA or RNA helicases of superfamily II [uncultured Caudovirales phage]CAB4191028.1 SSL2 DNA or RNA helicases of superfamily II [uncultured Caudovirales phage]CAB5229962.1 SSL2 DNA or RNA helicases of superfamily II [uncultured Caudovirales phage]
MVDVVRRRFFNLGQHQALYLAAGGRCETCDVELEPGWHADHVKPFSKGGVTDVVNGAALCPPCNLKKSDRETTTTVTTRTLRKWQTEAVGDIGIALRKTNRALLVACPGAGKTRFAAALAQELGAGQIIFVVPSAHLVNQTRESFAQDGLNLANGRGATSRPPKDTRGMVTTYQSVAASPEMYRKLSSDNTLVILDEGHHMEEEKTWGEALKCAFENARYVLVTTGTPFRSNGTAIPFLRYDSTGELIADYTYGWGRGWADAIIRRIYFEKVDTTAEWINGRTGEMLQGSLSDLTNRDDPAYGPTTQAALHPDSAWTNEALVLGVAELDKRRMTRNAAGLVICSSIKHATQVHKRLENLTNSGVVLVHSDMRDREQVIAAFRKSRQAWLVSVSMVSEGVDIPRLEVGVYATNKSTKLFMLQMFGRVMRIIPGEGEVAAKFFIPDRQDIIQVVSEMQKMQASVIEAEEKEVKTRESGERTLDGGSVILGDRDAHSTSIVLVGGRHMDGELIAALENVFPDEFHHLIPGIILGAETHSIQARTQPTIEISSPAVDLDEHDHLRKRLTKLEKRLADQLYADKYGSGSRNSRLFEEIIKKVARETNRSIGTGRNGNRPSWTADESRQAIRSVENRIGISVTA